MDSCNERTHEAESTWGVAFDASVVHCRMFAAWLVRATPVDTREDPVWHEAACALEAGFTHFSQGAARTAVMTFVEHMDVGGRNTGS